MKLGPRIASESTVGRPDKTGKRNGVNNGVNQAKRLGAKSGRGI
jgi:hypothetical protein